MTLTVGVLVRRALSAHRGAALLLATIIGVGAFLGAATPRWIESRFDETLRTVVADAGRRSELSNRAEIEPSVPVLNSTMAQLESRSGAELRAILGTGRWSVSTSTSQIMGQNGAPTDDGPLPRDTSIRVPDDLSARVELVAGALPAEVERIPLPPALADIPIPNDGELTIVDVVVTPPVAAEMRLAVGDVVVFEHRSAEASAIMPGGSMRAPAAARVTGIVEAVDPDDPIWADALNALEPDMGQRGGNTRTTTATMLTDPELLASWSPAMPALTAEWHVELNTSAISGAEVDELLGSLNRLGTATEWRSGLTDILDGYTARRTAAEGVVAFGVVSLAALCAALVVLAGRLVADRRVEEVALARARGAGDSAVFRLLAVDVAVVAVPAGCLGTAVARWIVPGPLGGLALAIPVSLVVLAVLAAPGMAVWLARRSGAGGSAERADVTSLRPSSRRLVGEAGTVVLAGVGLWLMSVRSAESGADVVVALVPLVVATAVALVIFRVMPLVVAGLLPVVRRSPGAVAFLALSKTARSPAHVVLPVIAMLVAIGIAAFGGTVESTVQRAAEVSSWDDVGGDARASSPVIRVDAATVATVPGATAAAVGHIIVSQRPVNLDTGRQAGVDILAVDVPGWAEVTAEAPEPVDPVAQLDSATPSGEIPAVLQGGIDGIAVGDRLEVTVTGAPVTVEVVDQVGAVPGAPGGSTLVVPLAALSDVPLGPIEVAYFSGDVSAAEVATTLGIDTGDVVVRSDSLRAIGADPVLGTISTAFTLISAIAAALAAVAAVLGLAVGRRSRAFGLSILRTLGLTTRHSAVLTAADVVPTSVMAAVVGVGTGLGVGAVAAASMDMPALSGSLSADTGIVVDLPGAAVAAAIVLSVVLIAVVVAVTSNRRASLGSALRAGDQT